ncbi:MAG: alpha/beta hydrolase [Leptospiraceae bacterium]|nr:alpha/beta hydrolase [Leptospiraceae bacterium]
MNFNFFFRINNLLVLSFLFCFLFYSSIPAQDQFSESIDYLHTESESFKAKIIKFAVRLMGMKSMIENDLNSGKIEQKPIPIPNSLKSNYDWTETEVSGQKIWSLSPKSLSSNKVILYLHGGAYIYNVTVQHWDIIEKLLEQTHSTVIIPDYPLAPNKKAKDVYLFLDIFYKELLKSSSSENLIIMGDSAGSGLTLGFTQFLIKEKKPLPSQIILLSPWLDVTMSNPDILSVDNDDKILGIKGLQLAGKTYAGDWNENDYRVSPIYGEVKGLPMISIFISTHDLFIADSRKFKKRLQSEKIHFNYFEYPKLFHDWVIITGLAESEHALNQIKNLINGKSN